jgi:hypothetical protein
VKFFILLLIAIFFSACTTQHAELDRYVDNDIQDVIAAYGQPVVAFQMEENRRDFQWVISSGDVPSYSISTGALLTSSEQIEPANDNETITPMFNNIPLMSECIYTLKTRRDDDTERWIVTGYQKPAAGC